MAAKTPQTAPARRKANRDLDGRRLRALPKAGRGGKSRDKKQPLAGVRVVVGRARHQASPLSLGLEALGAEVTEIPFITIRPPRSQKPFDRALERISEYDWLVVTSVNGVRALAARLRRLKIAAGRLRHLEVAAIGPATSEEVEKLGIRVAVVPEDYVAESVVASLDGRVKGKRVLLPRARVARDTLPRELRRMGARVDVVEAYETVVPPSSERKLRALIGDPGRRPHLVIFTSSSSARNFAALLGRSAVGARRSKSAEQLAGIRFASIGPITSATLGELGLSVDIEAKEYTIPGLIEAIKADWAVRKRTSSQ
jgi:uroporphyrinogen-III synthase